MIRQLILGMGTGQCGTELLAQILAQQPNTAVTHEQPPLLSWSPAAGAPGIRERLDRILATRKQRFVGDVASFYLPYVSAAIEYDSRIRIVCLQRPCEEVVAGFSVHLDRHSPLPLNHWARQPGPGWTHDFVRTRIYPQYDTADREGGLRRYWEEYAERSGELARRFPENVRIWDTDVLTTPQGVREVLDFVGIPRGDQALVTGRRPPLDEIRLAARHPPVPRYPHPQDPRRCAILVPFQGFIHAECDDALKALERRGYQVRRVGGYAAIDQGRNQMATDALLDGFEETLWIDSDIGFHPDDVERLRSHPDPMVCGIYPQKGKRALACHVMPGSPSLTFGQRGGLVELLYAGTGFLLIRREVYLTLLEQLRLPVCNERFGHPTFPFFLPLVREIEDGYWYLAEDYAFCQRARQCGFKIYADSSIRLWHIGQYRYGWEDAGLERQRFNTFTLNFGDGPGLAQATPTERHPALANFVAQYPWPQHKPEPPPFPQRNWLFPGTQELLERSVPRDARLIVEVGSWTGRSTRFLAGQAPQATIVAIDHWQGSPEHFNDPELAPALPHLFDTFLAECWSYRDQIVPVRLGSREGMERVAEAGLQPDVVYIDADHQYQSVVQDLLTALDLFPQASILGDDADWEDVRRAIVEVAQKRGLQWVALGAGWQVLRPGQAPPPQGKAK